MPVYLRKSCAFPVRLNSNGAALPPESPWGSGGAAAKEFVASSVKHSFTANRAAQPQKIYRRLAGLTPISRL
jgi:hypothetical protein